MAKMTLLIAFLLATMAFSAHGKTKTSPAETSQFRALEDHSRNRGSAPSQVAFQAAQQGTTYFGGTFWNADSMRWEALQDSMWTFDSGAGSHFNHNAPDVNPYKFPTLHAYMEGWVGIDLTFSEITYFRRVTDTDPRWETDICVGSSAGLGGSASLWVGMFPEEANELCFIAGQGYGNSWTVCRGKSLAYTEGGAILEFDFVNETEEGWDFTYVIIDTSGFGDEVVVTDFTGMTSGHEVLNLSPGIELPSVPRTVQVKFCFVSDDFWSDEDGFAPSTCGAFAIDNIALAGGIVDGPSDFETGEDGWLLLPPDPGAGGDWSNIVDLSDLPPPSTPCECNLSDSVLVFEDLNVGGHGPYQYNIAMSPWIDLKAAGLSGVPGKFMEFDGYADLPLGNYVTFTYKWQYYPVVCPVTGELVTSPILDDGWFYFTPGGAWCTSPGDPVRYEIEGAVEAEQFRVGVGVFNLCRFFANCSGAANSSPWVDNVRVGFYGNPDAPALWNSSSDPGDAFPDNGGMRINAPARFDAGFGGDTSALWFNDELGVRASTGGTEVRVQFSVAPGPGIDVVGLSSWLTSHQYEETRDGLDWYSARMDSSELPGIPPSRDRFVTRYHEEDPNFSGTDMDADPNDQHPEAFANDIFPDDLFTPGTRVNLFYKARFEGESEWFLLPDTTDGTFKEMEVFPSSMASDSTHNCIILVGGDRRFEQALAPVLPGGSSNFENTAWDRLDRGLGRPLNANYGASVTQALSYKVILWNKFSVSRVDAELLMPWLTLLEVESNSLYMSADAALWYPGAATRLVEDVAGVTLLCNTFRDFNCPPGSPYDDTYCVNIDPVAGAVVSTRPQGGTPVARGNGCPDNARFKVLIPSGSAAHGVPNPEETFSTGIKSAEYASISMDATAGPVYRTVVDGVPLWARGHDPGCPTEDGSTLAMEERLEEVLGWFGYLSGTSGCIDPTIGLGVPGEVGGDPPPTTRLLPFSPNPLMTSRTGKIRFSMARQGRAQIDIFDLNGRKVKTVFDGTASQGSNEAVWNGTDDFSRPVASGVYFYRLRTSDQEFTSKLVVVRN